MKLRGKSKGKPSALVSFFRYNLVALIATGLDFLILVLLTELLEVWYLISTIFAATCGALTAFLLGRYWVFVSIERKVHTQAFRFFIVAIGSIALNSFGVYAFTEFVALQYLISKIITSIIVGVGYNYLLGRYFVFN